MCSTDDKNRTLVSNVGRAIIKKLAVKFEGSEILKGTSSRKESLAQMKEREKCRRRAITDLNVPKGSRDIQFQSHEFEQYGCCHFVDF